MSDQQCRLTPVCVCIFKMLCNWKMAVKECIVLPKVEVGLLHLGFVATMRPCVHTFRTEPFVNPHLWWINVCECYRFTTYRTTQSNPPKRAAPMIRGHQDAFSFASKRTVFKSSSWDSAVN